MLRMTLLAACMVLISGVAVAEVLAASREDAGTQDADLQLLLTDGTYRYRIEVSGGKITGTLIDELRCYGGDIRGLYSAPGEFTMTAYNLARHEYSLVTSYVSDFLLKGALHLPPVTVQKIVEIGTAVSTVTLNYDVDDAWFHESVNDGGVQGWVPVGPQWMISYTQGSTSPGYSMIGIGINNWSDTYYMNCTYPRPGDSGYQYEACYRKVSGSNGTAIGHYFNTDGTVNNGVSVSISASGYYGAWEWVGGSAYTLIPWTLDKNLLIDNAGQDGWNASNMIKVEVAANGVFDIFINDHYVASAQAISNLSGYVGIRIYDGGPDWVSCDNMTVSTRTYPDEIVRGEIQRAKPAMGADPAVAPH
jgi:hypothetical protein